MLKEKIKSILITFFVIVLLFVVCLGIILLFKGNIIEEPVNAKDVTFVGDAHMVSIKNIVTVTSDFGRNIEETNNGAFGYLVFDVVNHTNAVRNYQIYLTKIEPSSNEIPNGYVVFYLTDGKNQALDGYTREVLPSYLDLQYLDDKADSKNLYTGKLNGGETAHFILRVWLSEVFVISNEEEEFLFKVNARAI